MINYRSDIDGLRALAVLAVLFFHLDIALFSGGFIGVDIFFTISGFLISGIIFKGLSTNNFSFKSFFIKRALRILPAYTFVLFCTVLIGVFLLTPIAFKELIESAISSSVFLSNIYFLLTQGGYFTNAAHELPLLHTWSLSVEEQFYLVMPLVFLFLYKIPSNFKKLLGLILLFFISALLSYFLTKYNQKIAYYIVLSRAFEFLVGAILAFIILNYRQKLNVNLILNHVLTFTSLILLVVSAIIINEKVAFPSLVALVPCLATALLIFTGLDNRSVTYKILGCPVLVFVGKISYSLYLWHWPIVAYCKYIGVEFTYIVQFTIAVVSFVLAFLSWKFIEQPIRHINGQSKAKMSLMFYVLPCLVVTSFYLIGKNYDFFPERFDSKIIDIELSIKSKPEFGRENCHTSNVEITSNSECFLGDISALNTDVILWGDSHANHFVGVMDELGKQSNLKVQDLTMGNCPPLIGVFVDLPKSRNNCIEKNNNVLAFIKSTQPKYVFFAASWAGYSDEIFTDYPKKTSIDVIQDNLINTIEQLQEMNIKVVVFKMLPRMKKDLSSCYAKMTRFPELHSEYDCQFKNDFKVNELEIFYSNINRLTSESVYFVDVSKFYCVNKLCNTWVNSTPLYRDNNHLNMEGSTLLGRLLSSSNQVVF